MYIKYFLGKYNNIFYVLFKQVNWESDEYVSKLTPQLEKIALDELRENDNIRSQSIVQFREFIAKHPYIKKCRTGITLLLKHILILNNLN